MRKKNQNKVSAEGKIGRNRFERHLAGRTLYQLNQIEATEGLDHEEYQWPVCGNALSYLFDKESQLSGLKLTNSKDDLNLILLLLPPQG